VDIFNHHHTDEFRVLPVMVESECHKACQRLARREIAQIKFIFAIAYFRIGRFQAGTVKPILVAEIIINHSFGGFCLIRNFVYAGTGQTAFSKQF